MLINTASNLTGTTVSLLALFPSLWHFYMLINTAFQLTGTSVCLLTLFPNVRCASLLFTEWSCTEMQILTWLMATCLKMEPGQAFLVCCRGVKWMLLICPLQCLHQGWTWWTSLCLQWKWGIAMYVGKVQYSEFSVLVPICSRRG